MYDAGFARAQAAYDAMEPPDDELAPPDLIEEVLGDLVYCLDSNGRLTDSQEVHHLSDRQATVAVWIDGREFSLTLNRED